MPIRKEPVATTAAKAEFNKINEDLKSDSFRNVDQRLSAILDVVFGEDNSGKDGNIPLTIIADGATITGVVISEDAWVDLQIAQVEGNDSFAEALRVFQDSANQGRKERQEAQTDDEAPRSLRTKLHFRNATIITGSRPVELQGLRVDLKHVSAWSLGEMIV